MSSIMYGKDRSKKYELGQKIKGGGEGTVYSIVGHSNLVAKVYKAERLSDSSLMKQTEEKILAMLSMNFDPRIDGKLIVAWPIDALYDSSGSFLGYVMPKIENMKSLIWAMRPSDRDALWPKGYRWRNSIAIAFNLSCVIEKIHASGIVVGDMNTNNILIDPTGNVTMIDAGSFNIRTKGGQLYKCIVGFPEVLPPELQGKDLTKSNNQFSEKTDCFALAIHIFTLLNNNCHPFGCLNYNTEHASSSNPKIMDNIVKGFCPYVDGGVENTVEDSLGMSVFSNEINALFKRAFQYDATTAVKQSTIANRPTAKEWREALAKFYSAGFVTCSNNSLHEYSKNYNGGCPWCAIEYKKKNNTGSGTSTGTGTGSGALPVKQKSISVVYCDKKGNTLRTSQVDVEFGKTAYAYAINIQGYHLIGTNSRKEISVDQNGKASQNEVRFTYEKDGAKKKRKHRFFLFLCIAAILYCAIMYGMIKTAVNGGEYEKALEYMGMFPLYNELFPSEYYSVQNTIRRIENQRRDKVLKDSIKLPYGIGLDMTLSEANKKMIQAGFTLYYYDYENLYIYDPCTISGWYKTEFTEMGKNDSGMYVDFIFTEDSIGNQITLNTAYSNIKTNLIEKYGQPSSEASDGAVWKSSNSRHSVNMGISHSMGWFSVTYYDYYSTY